MQDDTLTVTRQISLKTPAQDAAPLLTGLIGVAEAAPTAETRLSVTYDLRHVCLADLERRLADGGAVLGGSLWQSLHSRWLRFTEANQLENSRIVHQCCSTPPDAKKP